jgi:hypothetical protein
MQAQNAGSNPCPRFIFSETERLLSRQALYICSHSSGVDGLAASAGNAMHKMNNNDELPLNIAFIQCSICPTIKGAQGPIVRLFGLSWQRASVFPSSLQGADPDDLRLFLEHVKSSIERRCVPATRR